MCFTLREVTAYKLIIGIASHADQILEPLNSVPSAVSVAGSTKGKPQLQGHPLPIQLRKERRDGSQGCPSENPFAFDVEKLSSQLPLTRVLGGFTLY